MDFAYGMSAFHTKIEFRIYKFNFHFFTKNIESKIIIFAHLKEFNLK